MNKRMRKLLAEKLLREAGFILEEFYHQGINEVITDLRIRCLIDKDAKDAVGILHGLHFSRMLYQLHFGPVVYVRNAIARFVEGRFGYCQECGSDLPREWLRKNPLVEYCSQCMVKVSPSHRESAKRDEIAEQILY